MTTGKITLSAACTCAAAVETAIVAGPGFNSNPYVALTTVPSLTIDIISWAGGTPNIGDPWAFASPPAILVDSDMADTWIASVGLIQG